MGGAPRGARSGCSETIDNLLIDRTVTISASEGYKLSKPIIVKVTDLLYIDDLKIFASSESKLNRVMESTKNAMKDVGLQWNSKKCTGGGGGGGADPYP